MKRFPFRPLEPRDFEISRNEHRESRLSSLLMLYEPSSAIAVRAPALCRRSKYVLTSFRERVQVKKIKKIKKNQKSGTTKGGPSSSESLSRKANAEVRSISGSRRVILLRKEWSKRKTGAGRVPEQISSSSAATLNRDHFRKETATIYPVTRRT